MKIFLILIVIVFTQLIVVTNSFLQNFPSSIPVPSVNTMNLPPISFPTFDPLGPKPMNAKPLMYFTGAGVYVWWQLGVAKYIQENYDRKSILNSIAIGASAGSITSSLLLADIDFDQAPKLAEQLTEKYQIYSRKGGLGGMIGMMLDEWLNTLIDDNIDMNNFNNLYISLTPTKITPSTPKLVTNFVDKQDLINAIKASCHIPIFLDGKACANYRNESVIDGSFWYFITGDRWVGLPFPIEDNEKRRNNIENIIWIDYGDDEKFMKSITGNIVELIKPEEMYEMVNMGYEFMKMETEKQTIPLRKRSFTQSTISSAKKMANSLPKEFMKKMPQSMDDFYRPLNPAAYFRSLSLASTFSARAFPEPPSSLGELVLSATTTAENKPETSPAETNSDSEDEEDTKKKDDTSAFSSFKSQFPKLPKIRFSF